MQKKIFLFLSVFLLIALLAAGTVFFLDYRRREPRRNDFQRLETELYTSVFFSMFPIDNYTENDFIYHRALYPVKASYCIPDAKTLRSYLQKVSESENEIVSIYLGVRPDLITADDMIRLFDDMPDYCYNIIISYPSLAYWASLDDKKYPVVLQAYEDFVNSLMSLYQRDDWMGSHCYLFFYNFSEWLVGNPAHYESDFNVNAGISHMLSMYSDGVHNYDLTPDNYESRLSIFRELTENCRNTPPEYPNLEDWDIVFWGDSILDVENTTSIPSALSGFTAASTFNCSCGGSAAATVPGRERPSALELIDPFLAKDPSPVPEDSTAYLGLSDFLLNAQAEHQKCFVFNYGLNDYFKGYPIRSDDPHDISSYTGALRVSVEKLRAAYPDAVFVLMTPNYTTAFGYGREPQSDTGGSLADYIDAAAALAEEMSLLLFNTNEQLNLDFDNLSEYYPDGIHPNDITRYHIAQRLADLLAE